MKFDTRTVDNLLGLHAYMNHIVMNDPVIGEYNLKKVVQFWGIKEADYAYYMLAPPWIRLDPKDNVSSLYPDKIKSATISYSQKYNPIQLYSKSINL